MATPIILPSVTIQGDLSVTGTKPTYARSELAQEQLAVYPIPHTAWRVHDAMGSLLPSTPVTDDLGIVAGAFGTATPSLQSEDLKAAGATNKRARCVLWLPPEYDNGQTVVLRFNAGMLTTIADVSATIDAEMYKSDGSAGVDGSDLVTTPATDINSTTLALKDFAVTSTALAKGAVLDLRVTLAINDAATVTVVKGIIANSLLLLDIKG